MSSPPPETDRNITAFFGSRDAAEQAVSHLVDSGISRDRILLRMGAARTPGCVEEEGKGLLQEVKELILPSEEPDAAVAALKHEGYLLSVRPDADTHDEVFQSLEQVGGKGVESRQDIWPDWKSGQDRTAIEDETGKDASIGEDASVVDGVGTQGSDPADPGTRDPEAESDQALQPDKHPHLEAST